MKHFYPAEDIRALLNAHAEERAAADATIAALRSTSPQHEDGKSCARCNAVLDRYAALNIFVGGPDPTPAFAPQHDAPDFDAWWKLPNEKAFPSVDSNTIEEIVGEESLFRIAFGDCWNAALASHPVEEITASDDEDGEPCASCGHGTLEHLAIGCTLCPCLRWSSTSHPVHHDADALKRAESALLHSLPDGVILSYYEAECSAKAVLGAYGLRSKADSSDASAMIDVLESSPYANVEFAPGLRFLTATILAALRSLGAKERGAGDLDSSGHASFIIGDEDREQLRLAVRHHVGDLTDESFGEVVNVVEGIVEEQIDLRFAKVREQCDFVGGGNWTLQLVIDEHARRGTSTAWVRADLVREFIANWRTVSASNAYDRSNYLAIREVLDDFAALLDTHGAK